MYNIIEDNDIEDYDIEDYDNEYDDDNDDDDDYDDEDTYHDNLKLERYYLCTSNTLIDTLLEDLRLISITTEQIDEEALHHLCP